MRAKEKCQSIEACLRVRESEKKERNIFFLLGANRKVKTTKAKSNLFRFAERADTCAELFKLRGEKISIFAMKISQECFRFREVSMKIRFHSSRDESSLLEMCHIVQL